MECRGFKDVIKAINKECGITLTLSFQPYRSKTKTYDVSYNAVKHCLNWDMEVTGFKGKLAFKSVTGEKVSKWMTSIRTANIDLIEIPNFLGKETVKCTHFKEVVYEINQHKAVLLTICLWTYSSGRMTFKVPYDSIQQCLDKDMLITGDDNDLVSFTDSKGEEHSFSYDKIKIAKLDHLDIPNLSQTIEFI